MNYNDWLKITILNYNTADDDNFHLLSLVEAALVIHYGCRG